MISAIGNLAILAAQVTNFARVLVVGVTGGVIATPIGVKVGESARAVAVSRNWRLVDVEREGTAGLREIVETHSPLNACSAREGAASDRAIKNGVLVLIGEIGNEGSTWKVVGDYRSNVGLRGDDRSRGDE